LLTVSGNNDMGARDNTARIWDSATGEQLLVMRGHTDAVSLADWSPSGKRVATISPDGTARIWDATTGAELLSLDIPVIYNGFLNWSPDGRYLATTGNLNPLFVWRVWQSTEELISYAHECCVFRALTYEERQQYGLPSAEADQPTTINVPPTPGAALLLQPLALLALAIGLWRLRNSIFAAALTKN
jgi:hypothetical protein